MRSCKATLCIVLGALLIAAWSAGADPAPEVPDFDPAETPCEWVPPEPSAGRLGGFYTNFWPNGIVPYQFQTTSTDSFYSTTLNDVNFSIPVSGAQITSSTGFPSQWRQWDIIRVSGTNLNDARDFKIVGGTQATSRSPWTMVQVVPMGTSSFSTENTLGTPVTLWVTDRVSPENQSAFASAITVWEDASNIDIRPRNGEPDYIHIRNDDRSTVSGDVGHGSGLRTMSIDFWTNRTMRHETGHSLGAKHEHQRPDRNAWVTVDTTQTTPRGDANLNVDPTMAVYPNLIYDFGSIMHYNQNSFLQPGATGPAIAVIDPDSAAVWQTVMGTLSTLSEWDKRTMSFMYPESNWRFLDGGTVATWNDGNFITPYKDFDFALADMPTGGRLFITHPRNYVQPGTYSRAMTISAPQGGVTIRAN